MCKLNIKDKRILYELDSNSRQSYLQIGKKSRLSKSTVSYRINQMENEGIIKNYYTYIDGLKLGYIVLRLYSIFQYTTTELEQEIIDYFVKNKSAVCIYSLIGRYDFEVVFWIKDINKFYSFWQKTLDQYGDYFQDQVLSFYIKYTTFRYSYLLSEKEDIIHDKNIFTMGGSEKKEIESKDMKILKMIASNARMPITEIAKKSNMNSDTVGYHINKLIKDKIIQGFRANIDFQKIGYQYFKVDVYLRDYKQRNKIINYIKNNPHLVAIDETTGVSHLELEFHLKSLNKLHDIMNDINIKFPFALRNYKYFNIQKIHKYVFLPEE